MAIIRVAGFDPSFRNFGMVKGDLTIEKGSDPLFCLTELQLLETNKGTTKNRNLLQSADDFRRCRELHDGIAAFLHDVDMVCVEMPIGSQNANGAKAYGICIALLAGMSKHIPVIQVTPDQVKMASVKKKNATKQEVINWAFAKFPEADWLTRKLKGKLLPVAKNEHLADALAAIAAGLRTEQYAAFSLMMR